jgi:hypothetical protein
MIQNPTPGYTVKGYETNMPKTYLQAPVVAASPKRAKTWTILSGHQQMNG